MSSLNFTKMHGLGNDYVYVETLNQSLPDMPVGELARRLADRHFGVGGDGMILIMPPEQGVDAQVRMRMFNVDGTEGEMCGNGIRCVAKYAHDHGITAAKPMKVQTGAGVLSIDYALDAQGKLATATVDMGEPILDLPKVPVDESKLDDRLDAAHFVSMGNPHVVVFFEPDGTIEDPVLGAELEHHPALPNRANIHFAKVHGEAEADVYHWERGSGATLACGTGACAVCVAGVLAGKTGRKLTAKLPGGSLELEWRETDNHVFMTGPATEVYSGSIELGQ